MNDILEEVWNKVVGGLDWLKQVVFGEFDDTRSTSAIVADMLVSFVPGVIIVTSARDLTAVTIRLVRRPEKRDDVHEWMLIIACTIPLVLPILAAAVGAAAAGVGAIVGGIGGSEAGAALRAVCLLLIEKGGRMLAEVIGFLRKFVKGDVMAVLKDIQFAKYGKALVEYFGTFIAKMRIVILKLVEELRHYTWFSGIEELMAKLTKLEREFYAVQTKAVSAIPKALAELDARLQHLLSQALPKEEHLAYAGVPAGHVEPVKPTPTKMAAMPDNPLGTPKGVKKTPPAHEPVKEQPNLHPQKNLGPKSGANATEETLTPTSEDLAKIRKQYGLTNKNTIAAGRTNIPGLENKTFEGLSPALRREAGLPSLDDLYGTNRPIKSPNPNPIASRHAEEDLFNGLSKQIDEAGLSAQQLEGRTVNIHISNASGVCNTCYQGLENPLTTPGVIRQFSERYPGLNVQITAEGGMVRPGVNNITVRRGEIVGK